MKLKGCNWASDLSKAITHLSSRKTCKRNKIETFHFSNIEHTSFMISTIYCLPTSNYLLLTISTLCTAKVFSLLPILKCFIPKFILSYLINGNITKTEYFNLTLIIRKVINRKLKSVDMFDLLWLCHLPSSNRIINKNNSVIHHEHLQINLLK